MRLFLPIAVVAAVALLSAAAGSVREPFGGPETSMDRLCGVLNVINVPDDVREKCRAHVRNKGRDYCVKGCDPQSLCKFPVLEHCSVVNSNCDVTHSYIGPHLSSFNDHLPRFFLVKHGFCVHLVVGPLAAWTARADPAVLDVMMAFPKSILLPAVDPVFRDLAPHWVFDSAARDFAIPFHSPPDRPAFLAGDTVKSVERAIPVRSPAFVVYETSTSVAGRATWRETDADEVRELITRDIRERRPASPNRMVFSFFAAMADPGPGADPAVADNGVHRYTLAGGKLATFGAGEVDVGTEGPVCVLSSLVVNMQENGLVEEVREIVYHAGFFKLYRKVPDSRPLFGSALIDYEPVGVRFFLGALDPDSCKRLIAAATRA